MQSTDESSSSKSMGEMMLGGNVGGHQPNDDLIMYENLDEIKLEGDVRLTTAEAEVSSTVINSLAGVGTSRAGGGGGCVPGDGGEKEAPSLEQKYFNAFSISNSFALPSGSMVTTAAPKPIAFTTSKFVITQPSTSSPSSSSSTTSSTNTTLSSTLSATPTTIIHQQQPMLGQPQLIQTITNNSRLVIKQEPGMTATNFGHELRNFETISSVAAIGQPSPFVQQKNHQPSNLLHQDSRVQPTTVMAAAGSSGAVYIPSVVTTGTTPNTLPTIATTLMTQTTLMGGVRGVTQTIIRPKHHHSSSRGGGRTVARTSNCKPPPGAVNFERSYQICQAVIQNSPNRHQLRAQLRVPPSLIATPGGAPAPVKKDDQTQNNAITSSNKMVSAT